MKRWICLLLIMICCFGMESSLADRYVIGSPVEPVGVIPDAFVDVVEENRFMVVTYSNHGLFSVDDMDDTMVIIDRMDEMGNIITTCNIENDGLMLAEVLGTSDGGFLAAMSHFDASDKESIPSKLIKYTSDGEVEWACPLEGVNSSMLGYVFETEDGYSIVGNWEIPETKEQGVFSPCNVGCITVSRDGKRLDLRTLGGSSFDLMLAVRQKGEGYLLIVNALSRDGDFAEWIWSEPGIPYLRVSVDWDFQIVSAERISEEEAFEMTGASIGTVDGVSVYDMEGILADFDAGVPKLAVDYGEFYMIVSEQYLESSEEWPEYGETIYSAYDKTGMLLWRGTYRFDVEPYDEYGEDGG